MIRLYRAVCSAIEAHADALRLPPPEPQPEGAMAQVEATGQHQRNELNADALHRDEDWSEDPEERRRPRIGFNLDHVTRRSRP